MKNYLFLVLLSFLMSCKNDTKVEFNYDKKYGKVREIHTTYFNGENTNDGNISHRFVDSFNTKGNILKREMYLRTSVIDNRVRLFSTHIYKYDKSSGLNRVDILDEKGKLVGVGEYTKIDKNTISVLRFGLDKKFEFRENMVVDEENLLSSISEFDRDSVLINKKDFIRLDNKLINLSVHNDIKNKDKVTLQFKYLSFDKQGNYTKRKTNQKNTELQYLEIRDVFYYPNN